ncbi:hypothetical protein Q2941_25325 [Bradyrhizobium sp. UFLA05-153]
MKEVPVVEGFGTGFDPAQTSRLSGATGLRRVGFSPLGETLPGAKLPARQAHLLAERRRRYKARLKQGRMVVPVEVDGPILDLLLRVGIASEAQVAAACTQEGKQILGEAIAAFFRRSAL